MTNAHTMTILFRNCTRHKIINKLNVNCNIYTVSNRHLSNNTIINPSQTCLVFAGQGSIQNNMGSDIVDKYNDICSNIWNTISDANNNDLYNILYKNNDNIDIRRTDIAQPLIYGFCITTLQVFLHRLRLQKYNELAQYTIGHSLGEFTSLNVCNALSVYDTAKLLSVRGQSMYNACLPDVGSMCVLQPISIPYANEICNLVKQQLGSNLVCDISNINSHNQIVLAGHTECIERAISIARTGVGKQPPIRLAKLLNVTSPFHCNLMINAKQSLTDCINTLTWNKQLNLNIYTNVDAKLHTIEQNTENDLKQLQQCVIEQLCKPVLFYQSVLNAIRHNNITHFIEISPGRILSPLITSIAQYHNYNNIKTTCISNLQHIEQFVTEHIQT